MRSVMIWLGILRRLGQKAGPYLLLEMLLPGGTLLALLLFLCQRGRPDLLRATQRPLAVVTRTLASVFAHRTWVPAPFRVSIPVSKQP